MGLGRYGEYAVILGRKRQLVMLLGRLWENRDSALLAYDVFVNE
jgi:hypothetical protein